MRFEERHLGSDRFPDDLSDLEIGYFFGLGNQSRPLIKASRGALNRIGLALHIGFLKMTGRCLNSIQRVPMPVLRRIGEDLGLDVPDLASIRSLYRRRRTLHDHQALATELLERASVPTHAERALTAHLRREASSSYSTRILEHRAAVWLVTHGYLLPSSRRLRSLAAAALSWREVQLVRRIHATVGTGTTGHWMKALNARHRMGCSVLEYLTVAPKSRSSVELSRQLERIKLLQELEADKLGLPEFTMATLSHYGDRVGRRKPTMLARIREPRRTLELACFLRQSLKQTTDVAAHLIQSQTTDLWRRARDRAHLVERQHALRYRQLVVDLRVLVSQKEMSADELRQRIAGMIKGLSPEQMPSRLKLTRIELAKNGTKAARLVAAARKIGLSSDPSHPLQIAFAGLDAGSITGELSTGFVNPFGKSWAALIDQPDRMAALAACEAATALLLKRSLNNGSASLPHSDSWRAPRDRLITEDVWAKERHRLVHNLGISGRVNSFLDRIDAGLMASFAALEEAIQSGDVAVDKDTGRVSIPTPRRSKDKASRVKLRRTIQSAIGPAELPEVLVAVDAEGSFSKILLGRAATSERELVTLYAAVMACGTERSAVDLERMVPGLDAEAIGLMMRRLEIDNLLRKANEAVIAVMRRHRIVSNWGAGATASSDMMSLDATRRLWNARTDPKRRVFAVGTYTHVLDQWGIIYDQPIVLGKRQAGAAIQGVADQADIALERLAVDTHGFTHFGMALAKLLRFDLCPRLRGLARRKLFVPADIEVPDALRPLIAGRIPRATIEKGWEGLLLIACSVNSGWTPATWVLDRYGADAKGNTVHAAGDALGRLLKTQFLCDYFTQPDFRTEIQSLLSQGEAVHVLQRALHDGPIRSRKGRTHEELVAISGCLTLLANIVMAWNTSQLQSILDSGRLSLDQDDLAITSPIMHAHINLRGRFDFDLGQYRKQLLASEIRPKSALKS